MLSEVIRSELSYGAVPLAGQPPDQRFVQLGPLVAYSPITRSADYIFIRFCFKTERGCWRITHISCRFQRNDSSLCESVHRVDKSLRGQIQNL